MLFSAVVIVDGFEWFVLVKLFTFYLLLLYINKINLDYFLLLRIVFIIGNKFFTNAMGFPNFVTPWLIT